MVDERPPNVLFIVVDACRADYVSAYGGGPDATPEIDSFAEDATVFERAVSPAPWTLPSVTSLLTGADPHEHGATSRGFEQERVRTLQRELSEAGYRTIHISPKTWLGDWLPQGRGFDRVDEFTGPRHRYFDAGRDVRDLSEGVARGWEWYATVGRRALESDAPLRSLGNAAAFLAAEKTGDAWRDNVRASERAADIVDDRLAEAATDADVDVDAEADDDANADAEADADTDTDTDDHRPFFIYVHLMDPHLPFYVPDAFRTDSVRPPGCDGLADEEAYMQALMDDIWAVRNGRRRLSTEERRYLRTRYRDAVSYADECVGRMLRSLETRGLADETLVAVTADHGEHLGERVAEPAGETVADGDDGEGSGDRTLLDHQASIRLPVLRVPLLVRYPGEFDADRRSDLVQPHYLADTVRALAGFDYDRSRSLRPQDTDRLRDVATASYGGVVPAHPPADEATSFVTCPRTAAVSGDWKIDVIGDEDRRGQPVVADEAVGDLTISAGQTAPVDRAVRINWVTGEPTEQSIDAIPEETLRTLLNALASVRFPGPDSTETARPPVAAEPATSPADESMPSDVEDRLGDLGYLE